MEPRERRYSFMPNGFRFDDLPVPMYSDPSSVNVATHKFVGASSNLGIVYEGGSIPTCRPAMSDFHPIADLAIQYEYQGDDDYSDAILRYINQILMEEDSGENGCTLQESVGLQAAEKSLYEAIGERYPPTPPLNFDSPAEDLSCSNGCSSEFCECVDARANWAHDVEYRSNSYSELVESAPVYQISHSQSRFGSSASTVKDGPLESPISTLDVNDLYNGSQSVSLFMKGIEEASRLIPSSNKLFAGSQKIEREELCDGLKGKKHLNGNFEEEERNRKQVAVYDDANVHSDVFDEVLLDHAGDQNKAVCDLRETLLQSEAIKKTQQNEQSRGTGRKKNRRKVVDLRTLLINCAQAASADDRRTASEVLKQIRQDSSPFGDGNQRLAHCLANGLEARLAGTGSQIYRALVTKNTTAAGLLKPYLFYLAACPFRKVSNLFSCRTIGRLTRGAMRIHIIDFGIHYGFQWPTFIQRQSERAGGPPRIRITGIDFPQPGFRPAQRVEETGRRLAHYAKEFNVPFEFNPIAKRWETIQIEDFKLEEDEMVIVNCIYQMKNLPDETLVVEHSRNAILGIIRKIEPAIFIEGVVNGAYNAPFFLTRFREALFHFSSLFDMLETVMPRESEERLLVERDILGREALNVVACEGRERVERPETYRQWQAHTSRAGFVQLPIDRELKSRATQRVSSYHKEFVIDQDGHRLLLGWKGRILYALSSWKPA